MNPDRNIRIRFEEIMQSTNMVDMAMRDVNSRGVTQLTVSRSKSESLILTKFMFVPLVRIYSHVPASATLNGLDIPMTANRSVIITLLDRAECIYLG